jgi:hypothetical protein
MVMVLPLRSLRCNKYNDIEEREESRSESRGEKKNAKTKRPEER